MISKKEVQRVAKLARLGITKKEEEKFQKELSSILGYVEKLKKVDVSKIKPTSHPLKIENITRQDIGSEKQKEKSAGLLELAPETKNGYIKVKSIF